MGTALLVLLASWVGFNVVAVAAGDRVARLRRRHGLTTRIDEGAILQPARVTPTSDGYVSLLLTRLVVHARRVLGVNQAIMLVQEQRRPNRLIVVAAHGAD